MKSLIEYINESNKIELTSNGNEHGFEYVDLGLPSGTMWATCNVGATKPEDEGLLFQFGRVDGYKYSDENNKFKTNKQNKQDTGNEIIPKTETGKTYNVNKTLQTADDAANVNMGGRWRMPTNNHLNELLYNTTHNVVIVNGVKGMMFTSNINGHQMFIPFVQGYWYDGGWFGSAGSGASVWSSQVHGGFIYNACALSCYSSNSAFINNYTRSYALSVRGVFNFNEHNINMLI